MSPRDIKLQQFKNESGGDAINSAGLGVSHGAAHTAPLDTGQGQKRGGAERRRSQRVLLRMRAKIHVALKGTPTSFDVMTLSVNAHGALVAIPTNLTEGTLLVLENCVTREKIPCKVVRPSRESPEGFHTAIEFDSAAPDFWRIAFPPIDWVPVEV